jgi:hypothetical protein
MSIGGTPYIMASGSLPLGIVFMLPPSATYAPPITLLKELPFALWRMRLPEDF